MIRDMARALSALCLFGSLATSAIGWEFLPEVSLFSAEISFDQENMRDFLGRCVPAGDVDGDGLDDFLLSANNWPHGGPYVTHQGKVYLFLGASRHNWYKNAFLSVSDAGFFGEGYGDMADAVAAGDVNGDGFNDIVIGAALNDSAGTNAGKIYVVLGKSDIGYDPYYNHRNLANADASFVGEAAGDMAGYSIACGDVNGDGYDDILIGAPYYDGDWSDSGRVYLIAGNADMGSDVSYVNRPLSLAVAAFTGEAIQDNAGHSVSASGDINADGRDDILIGAPGYGAIYPETGKAYLVLGRDSVDYGFMDLHEADAEFTGEAGGDRTGSSVAVGGDANGDGYDDILIGAPGNDANGADAGRITLVLGQTEIVSDMSSFDGIASFPGEAAGDEAGDCIAFAGDTDSDGFDDILIGAPKASWGGEAYLVLGAVDIDAGFASIDTTFIGQHYNGMAGRYVSSAGDVDGDGTGDFLIGAPGSTDPPWDQSGEVYLFLSDYGVLYVDDNAPNDPGPQDESVSDPRENGSAEHPFDSIQEAINTAAIRPGAEVRVAEGEYVENILIYNSLTLQGGWENNNGSWSLPGTPLESNLWPYDWDLPTVNTIGGWIGEETVMEDLICWGRVPLLVYEASPTVRRCELNYGWSSTRAGAVLVESNGSVSDCVIGGGHGGAHYMGCGVLASGERPIVQRNRIHPGRDDLTGYSIGLASIESSPVLKNNVIFESVVPGKQYYCVVVYDKGPLYEPVVANNTLHSWGAKMNTGFMLDPSSEARVYNNIVCGEDDPDTSSYGVQGFWLELKNNDFWDLDCLYFGPCVNDILDLNSLFPGAWDNGNQDPGFQADGYHLYSSSPCIDHGLDVSDEVHGAVTDDIDGETRPAGGAWDVGADEYVPPAFTGRGADQEEPRGDRRVTRPSVSGEPVLPPEIRAKRGEGLLRMRGIFVRLEQLCETKNEWAVRMEKNGPDRL